jgi:G3E family GTPase
MRLVVFSGFLGSGKTTLTIALAKCLAASGQRTCFVVNEVGEIGIDQQVMRDGGLDVWEITSGCVCCQLASDLIATLHEISERFDPAVIIVEASGVATPSGILAALERYHGRPFTDRRMITVVDPTRLQVLLAVMTPLVEAQITQADEIVVSKLDEARTDEMKLAEATVQRLSPGVATWMVNANDAQRLEPLLAHLTEDAAR